jgi:hypothetical protein
MHPLAPAPPRPVDTPPAGSRVLLWLPLPVTVASGVLLLAGDAALVAGVDRVDDLHALIYVVIAFWIAVIGSVPFVLALAFTFVDSPQARATAALVSAVWTASTLLALTTWIAAEASDIPRSTTNGDQVVWQVAAALAALVPLAACVLARLGRR